MTVHPPVYYTVRSFVRVLVRVLAVGVVVVISSLVLTWWLNSGPQPCDVNLYPDGRWEAKSATDITSCVHPAGMTLLPDGRWEISMEP